ncbi:MAG: energy transducer TonB [Acidobacteriota bacterium]
MYTKFHTACLALVLATRTVGAAQSLAGVAQQEEDRRKAIAAPARVITDKDLRPVPTSAPEAKAAAPAEAGASAAVARKEAEKDYVAVAPAQYRAGALPGIPTVAISGGEAWLELTVDAEGRVTDIATLRHTAPFTEALTAAVRTWQFRPAEDAVRPETGRDVDLRTRKAVTSKVLVISLFRPPALYATTLGDPPKDVAGPSDAVPFPAASIAMPLFPPRAVFEGVVMAELHVGANGQLIKAAIIKPAPPFDGPTLDVVRRLTFRPSRVHGQAVPGFVYVIAGFRQPITPATGQAPQPGPPATP